MSFIHIFQIVIRTGSRLWPAILRIADVLDRDHRQRIGEFSLSYNAESVALQLSGSLKSGIDLSAFEKKSRLFTKVFGRNVKIF